MEGGIIKKSKNRRLEEIRLERRRTKGEQKEERETEKIEK